MSDCSSDSSEDNKFTPAKIEEKKTRPYLLLLDEKTKKYY
jgi:hypothetical protein